MKPVVRKEHGLWRMEPPWFRLFDACRAHESSRYAIEYVCVRDGVFAATNGRQLLVVTTGHKAAAGLYWPTKDRFLLPEQDAPNFPKYDDIILKGNNAKKVYCKIPWEQSSIGCLVWQINRTCGVAINIQMFLAAWTPLMQIGVKDLVLVHKGTNEGPIQIECSMANGKDQECNVLYVQMPISTDGWMEK